MPSIIEEPYNQLAAFMQSITSIMSAVGDNYGKNFEAVESAAYPCLTWRGMSFGKNPALDVKQHDYHIDRVPIAFWGPDENTLKGLAYELDEAAERFLRKAEAGEVRLDTTHFRCHRFRRDSDWQLIDWTGVQSREGRILKQLTADFLFSYKLRENPNRPPVITSNGGGDVTEVDVEESHLLVTTVAVSDPDHDVPAFAIVGGADAVFFTIDAASGLLQFVSAPVHADPQDANADNVYQVVVRASDGNGGSDQQAINVTVLQAIQMILNEAPAGTINGTNRVFTIANEPRGGAISLFKAGIAQTPGVGNDYVLAGQTITFAADNVPQVGNVLLANYQID